MDGSRPALRGYDPSRLRCQHAGPHGHEPPHPDSVLAVEESGTRAKRSPGHTEEESGTHANPSYTGPARRGRRLRGRGVRDTRESVLHGAGPEGQATSREMGTWALAIAPGCRTACVQPLVRGRTRAFGTGTPDPAGPPSAGRHCPGGHGNGTQTLPATATALLASSAGVVEGFGVRRRRRQARPGLRRAGASPGTAWSGRPAIAAAPARRRRRAAAC